MDVRLSPEQQALRDAAAHMVERLGPRAVADLDDTERRGRLGAALAASGWRELRDAGPEGAALASGVEAAVVAEELGCGLADVAFIGPVLASELRRRAALPAAAGIETILVDPGLGSLVVTDGGSPDAVAFDDTGAPAALALVRGDQASGFGLAHVALEDGELRWSGSTSPDDPYGSRWTTSTGGSQLDLTRPTRQVELAGARALETGRSLTDDDLTAFTALALALTCADLVGVMRGAVALARDYAVARRQYDSAIGSFQAVQHLLADAHVAAEGSRSVALHAAWAVDALAPQEAWAAATLAKAYCARGARSVCETVVQVHGGVGNTWDCLAHVYLRRALLSSELFGGADANVERVLAHHGIPVGSGSGHGLR